MLITSTLGQMREEACVADTEERRSWRRERPFPATIGRPAHGLTSTPRVSQSGPHYPGQGSPMAPPVLPMAQNARSTQNREQELTQRNTPLSSISQPAQLHSLHLIPKKPHGKAVQIPYEPIKFVFFFFKALAKAERIHTPIPLLCVSEVYVRATCRRTQSHTPLTTEVTASVEPELASLRTQAPNTAHHPRSIL